MTGIVHNAVKAHGDRGEAIEWNDDHGQTGDHDCNQHQHLQHVIENRTDWPAGPVEGQIIFRTDTGNGFLWNGSEWIGMNADDALFIAMVAL